MQKQEHLLGSQHAGVSHSPVETPKYKFILLLYTGMASCAERAVRRAGRAQNGRWAERAMFRMGLDMTWPLLNLDCRVGELSSFYWLEASGQF